MYIGTLLKHSFQLKFQSINYVLEDLNYSFVLSGRIRMVKSTSSLRISKKSFIFNDKPSITINS